MNYLESNILKSLMKKELIKRKVVMDSVNHVVNNLIQTSLRAVDSHGIHLFPHYIRAIESGRINKCPKMNVKKTSNGTAIIDADHGEGFCIGNIMKYAMRYGKKPDPVTGELKNQGDLLKIIHYAIIALHLWTEEEIN